MYHISFDETGDFENAEKRRNKDPLIIAGLAFEGDAGEIEKEKKRIRAYYEAVCDSVECKFPEDLHVSCDFGSNSNAASVAKVKRFVGETLPCFLSDGDYPGKNIIAAYERKRTGKYYVFAYVKGHEWKGSRRRLPSSLADDEKAGNLYMHMAQDMISRIVFHNPYFPGKKDVMLDIPTRRFIYDIKQEGHSKTEQGKYKREFETLGYKTGKYAQEGETLDYDMGNKEAYRIAVERELMSYGNEVTVVDFRVSSITYKSDSSRRMLFLYLADSINSILSYSLSGCRNCVTEIYSRLSNLAGPENVILYSYDDLDTLYGEAVLKAEAGDLFGAFSCLYDAEQINCESREYYREHPIRDLYRRIKQSAGAEEINAAIKKLSSFTYRNEVDRNKLFYLFEKMRELVESTNPKLSDQRERKNLFQIYDCGVSVFTHLGDSRKAEYYYKKCRELKDAADISELIVLNNKMIVYLSDVFAYKKAYLLACGNVKRAKAYADFRIKFFGSDRRDGDLCAGKAYSQLGQISAVYKSTVAEKSFKKALKLMKSDRIDFNITLSYYMHYLIEKGDKEGYMTWIKRYLGNKVDAEDQLKYIFKSASSGVPVNSRIINPEFALYVWLKGLYVFNIGVDEKLLLIFKDIDNAIKKAEVARGKGVANHPWEMIYKYIAFLLYRNGDVESADRYIEKAGNVNAGGEQIIKAIILNTNMQYAELKGDKDGVERYTEELSAQVVSMNPKLEQYLIGKERDKRRMVLSKLVKYMYE